MDRFAHNRMGTYHPLGNVVGGIVVQYLKTKCEDIVEDISD